MGVSFVELGRNGGVWRVAAVTDGWFVFVSWILPIWLRFTIDLQILLNTKIFFIVDQGHLLMG